MTPLPEATKTPCNECPWRRNAEPGFLDHHDPDGGRRMAAGGLAHLLVDQLLTKPGDPAAVNAELTRLADDLGPGRMGQVCISAVSIMFGECMRIVP